ncbi:MAG: HNH endonuclease [Actinomycetota bacterium]|nr:HNH endonuclease [Actinomycetota bacterium]
MLVWTTANGPVPDGYLVHHKNHDKHDNRLENLELMTHEAHSRHHNDKHPRVKTCASCGGSYEPHATHRERSQTCSWSCRNALLSAQRLASNGARKLSRDQWPAIRARVAAGERRTDLAREYGVSKSTMTRVTA